MRTLARRVMHAVALLLGVSLLSFAALELAPGDIASDLALGERVSPELLARIRAARGLDRPFVERYAEWLWRAARGDLGRSYAHDAAVSALLLPRAEKTLLLAVSGLAVSWSIALPLGMWAAAHPRGLIDRAAAVFTTGLQVVPDVTLALGALLLAVRTGWFPVGDIASTGSADLPGSSIAAAHQLVLPVVVLALVELPAIFRHVQSGLLHALDAPFVRAGMARGLPPSRLVARHALRAAAAPLVTLLGLSMAGLLSGSLVVEVVMGWPGLGPLTLDAVFARDAPLVIGGVVVATVLLIAARLASELLLPLVDPRLHP